MPIDWENNRIEEEMAETDCEIKVLQRIIKRLEKEKERQKKRLKIHHQRRQKSRIKFLKF